jgi:hypothetical protein
MDSSERPEHLHQAAGTDGEVTGRPGHGQGAEGVNGGIFTGIDFHGRAP